MTRTPDSVKREAPAWLAGFPDLEFVLEQMISANARLRSRLLLLTLEVSDIFVRATGIDHNAGKLPTLRSLSVRLIE
jgi:hypothetical protein